MSIQMDGVRHKQRNISSAYLYIRLYIKTDARFYTKQRSQSSLLIKQAKKISSKQCHKFVRRPLVRMCCI